MSEAWLAVIILGAATLALKCAGPLLLSGRALGQTLNNALAALVPAALAALVVVGALADGRAVVADARLVGTGAAGVAIAVKAPLTVVIAAAAATTALARQLA